MTQRAHTDPIDPIWDPIGGLLPTPGEAVAALVRVEAVAAAMHHPSILLLDDDPHMLEVLTRTVRRMGYARTSSATSAAEALLQLEHDPDSGEVIICDLTMPDIDGIEFLQTLNASPFRGSVILLSGQSERVMHSVQRVLGGRQLTILGALTKPVDRAALRALLDGWRPPLKQQPAPAAVPVTADEVRRANSEHQWTLHFQPQVNLLTGAFVGLEALIRWNHPERGLLYPDQFIAVAEESGAIDDMTDWVIGEALRQRSRWLGQGLDLQIAVNISMASLMAPDYWRRVTTLVRDAGAAPRDLVLELTESQLPHSSLIPLENLVRLRLQRFTLSIDDFGTGHSSLAQLRDVPFTELKVDRGFVHGARDSQIIRPMLEGSLGIARRMGLRSVAEGVETLADWGLLRELDCDLAQGYYIGRPMSAEQVSAWHRSWQARIPDLIRL